MIKKLGKLAKIAKLLSNHKGKALIGAGLLPVAYLTWKKRGAISDGVKGIAAKVKAAKTGVSRLGDSRKTDLVNTVRFMLSKYDTGDFHIIYGRDRKEGYMGYHVRTDMASLFFGWLDGIEAEHPDTPFWIVLDPAATRAFEEKNLKLHYDLYENPMDPGSIIVPVPLDMIGDPGAVAGSVIEIARKTLQ